MKAIQAHPQHGLDGLTLVDLPDPGAVGHGDASVGGR